MLRATTTPTARSRRNIGRCGRRATTRPSLPSREYWKRNYGPTIAAYRFNAGAPERVEALDRDFLIVLTEWNQGGPTIAAYDAEYLLVTATKGYVVRKFHMNICSSRQMWGGGSRLMV